MGGLLGSGRGAGRPRHEPRPGPADPLSARVTLAGVSRSFASAGGGPPVTAVRDVSLSIAADSFVTLLGPSGCGKTTLLRLICGLVRPDSGQVTVAGAPPVPGPHIGFVFQSYRLVPWLDLRANVGFGLAVNGVATAERQERVDRSLAAVGLSRFASAYPHELSGGMKQRAAIARALSGDPDILLMDEPFASLDAQTRELMQAELLRLWEGRPRVVVFVTHSVDEAILLSDRIALMSPRPGRIVETLDVGLPRPRDPEALRNSAAYGALRDHLWRRIRQMVIEDPQSDFHAAAAQ